MGLSRGISSILMILMLCSTNVLGAELLQACLTDADCGVGLYCANCLAASDVAMRCIRKDATVLPANYTSLPFNKASWLVAHNAYAITGFPLENGPRITFTNQEDNITFQLANGVRGLMLDTYDFKNDVWLCHSFGGHCYDITSFQPLVKAMNEVQTFLAANPSEIITIILEDYVAAPNGLTNVFKAANVSQYMFPLASMPTNGSDWPTIATMVQNNWRLLVFTSNSSKQAAEGIAYQWNFMVENQYGDAGMVPGNCTNRAESKVLTDTTRSLILQNFFRSEPIATDSCQDNSLSLYDQLQPCYVAAGNRWPNFLAVDYYKRSTGGGAFQAVDKLNGQMECDCNSPVSCPSQTALNACPADPSLAEYQATFVPPV